MKVSFITKASTINSNSLAWEFMRYVDALKKELLKTGINEELASASSKLDFLFATFLFDISDEKPDGIVLEKYKKKDRSLNVNLYWTLLSFQDIPPAKREEALFNRTIEGFKALAINSLEPELGIIQRVVNKMEGIASARYQTVIHSNASVKIREDNNDSPTQLRVAINGSQPEFDELVQLEEKISSMLSENDEVDGHDFDGNTFNIFIISDDLDALENEIKPILNQSNYRNRYKIYKNDE